MSALRVYVRGVDEFDRDGYPLAWSKGDPPVKDLVREAAGHRCVRCGHPYRVRAGMGEWSPCDERCTHDGPVRCSTYGQLQIVTAEHREACKAVHEARYRILTVHHLTGEKADCRWWNLAALCQRCHLTIQGRVVMERTWAHEHSDWFRPHAAGYYAWRFLGEDIGREEAVGRLDELLALEVRQLTLEGAA